jgi:two-component system cell cycle sensor histidine kinase PleC
MAEFSLADALEGANTANYSKSLFLANMSHELRTPLNAVIGFSSLLEETDLTNLSPAKIKEYLFDIRSSGEQLLSLVNDLIDISKIEEDQLDILLEPVSIDEVVNMAIKMNSADARKRDMTFETGDLNINVLADSRTLIQVISNLASNAIKYSPLSSKITISAQSTLERVTICVEDEGPGIAKDIVDRIGEPFLRAETSDVRMTEGAGLGLALSRRLLERQNGKMFFENRDPVGTIASVELQGAN